MPPANEVVLENPLLVNGQIQPSIVARTAGYLGISMRVEVAQESLPPKLLPCRRSARSPQLLRASDGNVR